MFIISLCDVAVKVFSNTQFCSEVKIKYELLMIAYITLIAL